MKSFVTDTDEMGRMDFHIKVCNAILETLLRLCNFFGENLEESVIYPRHEGNSVFNLLLAPLADIPQVACSLTTRSPDLGRWTSDFQPERSLL